MQNIEEFLSAAGLVIVLALGVVVLRTVIAMIFGKRRNQALLGLQFMLFFGLAYGFHGPLAAIAGMQALAGDIGKALASLLWFSVAFFATGALNRYVWHGALAKDGQPTVPRLLTDFVQVFIYLAAIMVVMHFVYDQSITALAATSGAFAFVIGYSAQSTLAELFAGISLNLARSIKKGDIVRIGETFGRVADVNWRCVSIMEPKSGSTVVMPNSSVAAADITNYSLPEPLYRRAVYFTTEYSAPPDLVIRAVTEHLRRARSILSDPAPLVHVREFTSLGTEFRALWYLRRDGDWWRAWNEAHDAIWSALREQGIQPGLNHRDAGPGGRFDRDAWSERMAEADDAGPAHIAASPLFEDLDETEVGQLAAAATRHHVGGTDLICERGHEGGALYVIADGRVAMIQTDEAGEAFTGAELSDGDVIGLDAAANGGTYRANAQAIQNSVVYEIPAEAVRALSGNSAAFARKLKDMAAARITEYEQGEAAHRRERARESNRADKQQLIAALSGQVREIFSGGIKRALFTVFTGGVENGRSAALLDAIMSATALVAAADGDVEAEEREHVVRTLDSLDVLRQANVDSDEAMAMFDEYCRDIRDDPAEQVGKALERIGKVAKDRAGAELVVGISEAISAADGEMEPAEETRIREIRSVLNVGGGDDVEG